MNTFISYNFFMYFCFSDSFFFSANLCYLFWMIIYEVGAVQGGLGMTTFQSLGSKATLVTELSSNYVGLKVNCLYRQARSAYVSFAWKNDKIMYKSLFPWSIELNPTVSQREVFYAWGVYLTFFIYMGKLRGRSFRSTAITIEFQLPSCLLRFVVNHVSNCSF